MSRERTKPRSTRVIPDKRAVERDAETKREATVSLEDACIARQNAGLGGCGKCSVCADDFFFEQICDECEGIEPTKH
jgi:hypothetical protein